MTIRVAKSTGFCSGVQRAVKGTRRALEEKGRIYCLGEIIHNPQVVESLKKQGLIVVDDIESVPDGSNFVIRSHGLPKDLIRRARSKELVIADLTCPKVKNIHRLVTRLSEEGYFIIIVGNPMHPEVKAIFSLTAGNSGRKVLVVQSTDDLGALRRDDHHSDAPRQDAAISDDASGTDPDSREKTAVVVQTTFDPQRFLDIVRETVSLSKTTLVCNTLCEETIKRQREAIALAASVEFIVVVGGKNSSNTRTLFEMVRRKVPALHIEGVNELSMERLRGIRSVGIISGASTPEEEVREVQERLLRYSEGSR